jgi:hypothetical protein
MTVHSVYSTLSIEYTISMVLIAFNFFYKGYAQLLS